MKVVIFIIMVGMVCSCGINKKSNYYYVEPFQEQEVKLLLHKDSTFNFQDLTGCNQFKFTGRYRWIWDSAFNYLVFDSVKLQSGLSVVNPDFIFSIKSGDTAWIINSERIFIHKQPFIATSNTNINLQDIRYKKLEEYYVGLLGRKGFIKVFGNGKRKKEAKRRLLDCKPPDVNIK